MRTVASRADTGNIDGWFKRVSSILVSLIAGAWRTVRELTAQYLAEHAAAEGHELEPELAEWVTEQVLTSLRVSGPVAFKEAVRAGKSEDQAKRSMTNQLVGASERLVLNADRETVLSTFDSSDVIVGWRRVGDGDPCAFCAMLISRGAVYKSGRTAGDARFSGTEYHDGDRCTAEPLYEHEDEPDDVAELYQQWLDVTAGLSGQDALRAWRTWWDSDRETIPAREPARPRERMQITPHDPAEIFRGETDSRFLGLEGEDKQPARFDWLDDDTDDDADDLDAEIKVLGDGDFGNRPSIDRLIPRTWQEAYAWDRSIKQAVADRLNGVYAGFQVQVSEVKSDVNAIQVEAIIRNDAGLTVGQVKRNLYRDNDGHLFVSHALLQLDKPVQGQGFSQAWNAYLETWYRESGVGYIRTTANIDVGGYTWARSGFDFADMMGPELIKGRLLALFNDESAFDDDQFDAVETMIERLGKPFGSPEFPTAYEVSQVGRKPGQGRSDRWPGKQAMLGSTWSGVKWLK